jgi:hypothetical protein
MPVYQLFDMRGDPGETRDVISDQPAAAARLKRELDEIMEADVGARRTESDLSPDEREYLRALGCIL